jgi:hypothetical protein
MVQTYTRSLTRWSRGHVGGHVFIKHYQLYDHHDQYDFCLSEGTRDRAVPYKAQSGKNLVMVVMTRLFWLRIIGLEYDHLCDHLLKKVVMAVTKCLIAISYLALGVKVVMLPLPAERVA